MTDEKRWPVAGEWVQVWGQIVAGKTHPEDVMVEFFSHSEQYQAHVRIDRVEKSEFLPDFVEMCRALRMTNKGNLRRCVRHEKHGGDHWDVRGRKFSNIGVAGFFEDV